MQFDLVFIIIRIMKKTLIILVLLFSSSVVADDISDFEIEGMSIGDNLLDFFSEEEVESHIRNEAYQYKKDKKFKTVQFYKFPFFKTYEYLVISYKTINSKNFEIGSVSGGIIFNDFQKCILKQDEIIEEFSSLFPGINKDNKEIFDHQSDPSGKSKVSSISQVINGGDITIQCFDFSEEMNWQDSLQVTIGTEDVRIWFSNRID